ncbi:chemotaxis protein CheD [Myxococcota bacterium]|nr:chemotaxis protein CheD [Myxococcota bacterium]
MTEYPAFLDVHPGPPGGNGPLPSEVVTGAWMVQCGGALRASAIGSCMAVGIADIKNKVGGLAHILLPGVAPAGRKDRTHLYAGEVLPALVDQIRGLGGERMVAVIAGGGNVLRRPDDTICGANIRSAREVLEKLGVVILASSVGGFERRGFRMDLERVAFYCTTGCGVEELLWCNPRE